MSKGALFIRLYYPGYIGLLESSAFTGEIGGRLASIQVIRHLRPVEILDFGNEIKARIVGDKTDAELKNKDFSFTENSIAAIVSGEVIFIIDNLGRDYRRFRHRTFTELGIAYEIDSAPNYTDEDFNRHEWFLEWFINRYRCITRDVKISLPKNLRRDVPMVQVASIEYDEEDLKVDREERLLKERTLRFGVKQMSVREYEDDIPKVRHNLEEASTAMASPVQFSPYITGLVNALEEVGINKNPTYAFLSAFIVAEIMLDSYLHQLKIKRGASKSKLDDFEEEVPFSYLLNVELPVLIGNPTDNERQIIGRMDKVRKKRNDIIHKAATVSEQEAVEAINAVDGLRALLNSHPF
jgi:hypothetical protein